MRFADREKRKAYTHQKKQKRPEYEGDITQTENKKRSCRKPAYDSSVGATGRNRTADLILTKDALYRLSHSSISKQRLLYISLLILSSVFYRNKQIRLIIFYVDRQYDLRKNNEKSVKNDLFLFIFLIRYDILVLIMGNVYLTFLFCRRFACKERFFG